MYSPVMITPERNCTVWPACPGATGGPLSCATAENDAESIMHAANTPAIPIARRPAPGVIRSFISTSQPPLGAKLALLQTFQRVPALAIEAYVS